MHIRFEDDYYAEIGKPYAFGILVDHLSCVNSRDSDVSANKKLTC